MDKRKQKIIIYPVRFTEEEMGYVEALMDKMKLASRAQVIKCLVNAARVRPSSIKFLQTDETNKVTA